MLNLLFVFEWQNYVRPLLKGLCIHLCLGWALLEGAGHLESAYDLAVKKGS